MDNGERGLHHGDTLRSFLTKHASFITNMGVENSRNKGQDDMINQNTAKQNHPSDKHILPCLQMSDSLQKKKSHLAEDNDYLVSVSSDDV